MSLKRKSLLTLLFGLFVALVLAACGGGGSDDASSSNDGGDSSESSSEKSGGGDLRTVKIGGIFDITGGTGDVGTPYAEGAEAYAEWYNTLEDRKVNIELIGKDYAYEIPKAQADYQEFRDKEGVSAIVGWGTGDTEALRQQVAQDELPFMSASYSENLKNIDESPYNFLVAASYSDQGRAVLKWISENHEGDDPPKVALLYNDTAYGRSPIDDIKNAAPDFGVEIVDEQVIDVAATEAQSQMMNMAKAEPDYAIIQQTWNATSVILNEAQTLGLDTQFIGLNWSAGEGLLEMVNPGAAEGFIATLSHVFPYEDYPGLAEIEEYLETKGKTLEDIDQKFVQGWATMKVMAAGIEAAADLTDGEITGAHIREGLESLSDFDLGGLQPNVSFGPEKHWGTEQTRLGIVKDGKWEQLTDYFSANE